MNTCDNCEKVTNEAYEMPNGDYYCEDCYTTYIDRAIYKCEDMLGNEATGN